MSERSGRTRQILISDRETGLPFSKGLLASQIMVTGLSPYRAYQVAEEVELRLTEGRRGSIESSELRRGICSPFARRSFHSWMRPSLRSRRASSRSMSVNLIRAPDPHAW